MGAPKSPKPIKLDPNDAHGLERIAAGKASAGDRDRSLLVVTQVVHVLLSRVERLERLTAPLWRRVLWRILAAVRWLSSPIGRKVQP